MHNTVSDITPTDQIHKATPDITILPDTDLYKDEGPIGKGGFGVVTRLRNTSTNRVYAVKVTEKFTRHGEEEPCSEAILLSALKSDRIANLVGMIPDSQYHMVVYELGEGGDLREWMKANRGRISDDLLWTWFTQLSEGLAYLHEGWENGVTPHRWKTIVHGDIKPENIVITFHNSFPTLKNCDFGTARMNPEPDIPLPYYGTRKFHPPEIFEHYGPQNDVWGLGCVIHLLGHRLMPWVTKPRPWASLEECKQEILPKIKNREPPIRSPEYYCKAMYEESEYKFEPIPLTLRHPKMGGRPFPKPLSHFMMRALDLDYRTRISAVTLARLLPVVQELHRKLSAIGYAEVLETFDGGLDESFNRKNTVLEIDAILDIATRVGYALHKNGIPIREYVGPLQQFMRIEEGNGLFEVMMRRMEES